MKTIHLLTVLLIVCQCGCIHSEDKRSQLKGLVYEVEDWSSPKDAWVLDEHPPDKWCLWTKEQDAFRKRSGGRSLQSPPIKQDRKSPEDGAPPLHTRITGIPAGIYRVFMNNPNRNIAISYNGRDWEKCKPANEIDLGLCRITDGVFEIWVDDRYATPENIGPCYYDYIRFERVSEPRFSHLSSFTLGNGGTQISWVTDLPVSGSVVAFGKGGKLDKTVREPDRLVRNHRVVLPKLEKGEKYSAQVRILSKWGDVIFRSHALEFVAGKRPSIARSKPCKVELSVEERTDVERPAWAVTSGVPFAKGVLARAEDAWLTDGTGKAIPCQLTPLAWWEDGSIKWLLLDFIAPSEGKYVLNVSPDEHPTPTPRRPVRVERLDDGSLVVTNGVLSLKLDRKDFALFESIAFDANRDGKLSADEVITGRPLMGNGRIVTADGKAFGLGAPDKIVVEDEGAIRSTVCIEGSFVAKDGGRLFRYIARVHCYAGLPYLRVQFTIGNDNLSQVMTELSSAALRVPIKSDEALSGKIEGSDWISVDSDDDLWLLQDYDEHYILHAKDKKTEGERAAGAAAVRIGAVRVVAFMRDFWQTYPKGIAIKRDGIHLRILPELPATQYTSEEDLRRIVPLFYCYREGKYLVKRGLQFTTDIYLRFDRESETTMTLPAVASCFQRPFFAAAAPDYYCRSGVFGLVDARKEGEFPRYARAFDECFEALEKRRQREHLYGWMNYGDWFGERKHNWGNSEYDLQWVMALHFARTGDLRFLRRGYQMAKHNTDIDTIHYLENPYQPIIVYAHSVGHVGGFFDINDPRVKDKDIKIWARGAFIRGAIDGSGGHTFEQGNFFYGFLMGERRFLDVAERVCAQQAAYRTYPWNFSIERAAGWCMINAMSAYEATGNPFYLNAARIYLERIFELQDPNTGGWRMPQGPPECDCPERHIGGKTFATGILLHGLIMFDRNSPDDRVKRSIVRAADWLMNYAWNKEKQGFRYKTGCPKYKDSANCSTSAALVAEAIAYAYEITHDGKYRKFLLNYLWRVLKSRTNFGKGFAMLFRQLPFALYYLRRWGVTSLPEPPPPPDVDFRKIVYLDESGESEFSVFVTNGGTAPLDCEAEVAEINGGLKVEPRRLRWKAVPGVSCSPAISVSSAGPTLTRAAFSLSVKAGAVRIEPTRIIVVRIEPMKKVGGKLGFLGPADHFSVKALREVGAQLEVITSPVRADLSRFKAIVVGSDVLKDLRPAFERLSRELIRFVSGGGRLVFLQLNDSDWRLDYLPFDLLLVEDNGMAAKITAPEHPLFAKATKVTSIRGATCYDTIAYAAPAFRVLALDGDGKPCVLSTRYGDGEIIVIEPSLDRFLLSSDEAARALAPEICKAFLENLIAYISR